MQSASNQEILRPRDLALLLLASGDLLPRQRARDQQADLLGLELKRGILERVAALDPEPTELESALVRIIEETAAPPGPTRAVAVSFLEEWCTACVTPAWTAHLLHEATRQSTKLQPSASKGRHRDDSPSA